MYWRCGRPIVTDGRRWACVEGIRDVIIKGKAGEEKVFVGIERRFGKVDSGDTADSLRERLWHPNQEEFAESNLIERRNIVFMQAKSSAELAAAKEQDTSSRVTKILKRK